MDRRSIAILREDGVDTRNQVSLPAGTAVALLVQLELRRTSRRPRRTIKSSARSSPAAPDTALTRFCRLLNGSALLDVTELALPGDRRRTEQLVAIREGVPAGVNQRVGAAKRDVDPRIEKTAADMVVPVEHFAEMMEIYRRGFETRGAGLRHLGPHLRRQRAPERDSAIATTTWCAGKRRSWNSDERSPGSADVRSPSTASGAIPSSRRCCASCTETTGIEQMRAVKRALDPQWKLAPGVIFER